MTVAEVRKELGLLIDGVVLPMPPADEVGRWNHCMAGETHMWRTSGEAASPELSGGDAYANQVTIERAVPFWGGISGGGSKFDSSRVKSESAEALSFFLS